MKHRGNQGTEPAQFSSASGAARARERVTEMPARPKPGEADREQVARLAYRYWEEGGRREGTAEEDWLRAEQDLQSEDFD